MPQRFVDLSIYLENDVISEKLHNLEVLPASGFIVSCFPHKIRGASAGWTRAVAIFDD